MKTHMSQFRLVFNFQDSQGYKWADSLQVLALSLDSAEDAGRQYANYVNAKNNGQMITGYRALETTKG